jgi:hypothetical protein
LRGQQRIGALCALSVLHVGGEAAVLAYRMYFLNNEDRIVDFIEHLCPDDPSALDRARMLAEGSPIEIWQAKRRVALVAPGRDPILFGDSHPR